MQDTQTAAGTGSDPRGCTEFGRDMLRMEAAALERTAERLGPPFERAVDLLDRCAGKVITTGVGKSGIAARKLASTLTSTGCAAVYMHPAEAMHGDLGLVSPLDVTVAISNGGETQELLSILPSILARDAAVVAIVGNMRSTLASRSTVALDASVEREACPLNLAPTTSVIVAMGIGDALAMALQRLRGFQPEDYARNHPGGSLGRRLTLRVRDVMTTGSDTLPCVPPDASLMDVLAEITKKCLGATCVTRIDRKLLGIITDYDVRNALQQFGQDAFSRVADDIMTRQPAVTLQPDQLAYDALKLMENRPRVISVAPVLAPDGTCLGMLRVHDLVRAGV